MSQPEAEFQQALTDLEDVLRRGIKAFAEWYSNEWRLTAEQWAREYADPAPGGPEWFAGYNAGVAAVLMGCNQFLDEFSP